MKDPKPETQKAYDILMKSYPSIDPNLYSDLPTLGPYEYPDGSTYKG